MGVLNELFKLLFGSNKSEEEQVIDAERAENKLERDEARTQVVVTRRRRRKMKQDRKLGREEDRLAAAEVGLRPRKYRRLKRRDLRRGGTGEVITPRRRRRRR